MTKRAVLYARKSTDAKPGDTGIPGQLALGREYASEKGYTVVGEFSESGVSGADIEAPELQRILALAEQRAIDVVVTREIDRLSRTLVKQLVIESRLRDMGVEIDYVLGDYPDTPEGQLNKLVRAVISEYERVKIVERMHRGRVLKARAGKVLAMGMPPYGYQYGPDRSSLVIVEHEAAIVREVFERYASGGCSMRSLARDLTRRGVLTRGDVHPGRQKQLPRGHWSLHNIRRILYGRTYMGRWHYAGEVVDVPAIVEPELFRQVQARRRTNRQRNKRRTRREYLLQHWVVCGLCGEAMNCRHQSGRYRYYICRRRNRSRNGMEYYHCDNISHRVQWIDRAVWAWLVDAIGTPEGLAMLEAKLTEGQPTTTWLEGQLAAQCEVIAELERQRDRLLDVYIKGTYSIDELNARRAQLDGRIAEERAARDAITRQIREVEESGLCAESTAWRNLLHTERDRPFAARREIVNALGEDGWRFALSPAPPKLGHKKRRSRVAVLWRGVELGGFIV